MSDVHNVPKPRKTLFCMYINRLSLLSNGPQKKRRYTFLVGEADLV